MRVEIMKFRQKSIKLQQKIMKLRQKIIASRNTFLTACGLDAKGRKSRGISQWIENDLNKKQRIGRELTADKLQFNNRDEFEEKFSLFTYCNEIDLENKQGDMSEMIMIDGSLIGDTLGWFFERDLNLSMLDKEDKISYMEQFVNAACEPELNTMKALETAAKTDLSLDKDDLKYMREKYRELKKEVAFKRRFLSEEIMELDKAIYDSVEEEKETLDAKVMYDLEHNVDLYNAEQLDLVLNAVEVMWSLKEIYWSTFVKASLVCLARIVRKIPEIYMSYTVGKYKLFETKQHTYYHKDFEIFKEHYKEIVLKENLRNAGSINPDTMTNHSVDTTDDDSCVIDPDASFFGRVGLNHNRYAEMIDLKNISDDEIVLQGFLLAQEAQEYMGHSLPKGSKDVSIATAVIALTRANGNKAEAARMVDMPYSTFRDRISRARKIMEEKLATQEISSSEFDEFSKGF